ncbi:MAG: diguanylate cyclase [Ignavibacteria bacterium]|nr:diguanylate cyclase [Ignavibacteria bacterium]
MPKQKVDLFKVFQPSDAVAFIAIGIGLVIAVIAPGDNLAVRLIGICIAILGGVALFMMVSPRLTDLQIITPIRPSATPDLSSRTTQDATKKSQTFDPDAYRESFGQAEAEEATFVDERQTTLFEDQSTPTVQAPILGVDLTVDTETSVRIVGVKQPNPSTIEPPKLISEMRQAARAAIIDVPINEEIQLSEDVIIRPLHTPAAGVEQPDEEVTSLDAENDSAPIFVSDDETVTIIDAPSSDSVQMVFVDPDVADDADLTSEVLEIADQQVDEVVFYNDPAPLASAEQDIVAASSPVVRETSRRSPVVSLSTFVNEADDEDMSSQEPRREFDYLLNRVLMVIRSATNARTAAFLWVNHERQQLVVEAKITEAEAEFTSQRKISMGHDALSQIAREGRPEIITQISPTAELELLPYYERTASTVSFIGVPVYYGGNVVGILFADSLVEDAYSDITVGFFGQFTKLISGLVSSYTSKYDLLHANTTLEALRHFRNALGSGTPTLQQVIKAMFGTLIQYMDISRIGVVSFDGQQRSWTLTDARSAMEDGYRGHVGVAVDLSRSLVGQTIQSATTVAKTDDGSSVRVFDSEPPLDGGQFVAVPLATSTESFGALFMENLESSLSQQDIALAEALGEHIGSVFEQIHRATTLEHSALLDSATGVLNAQGFDMRIREEFARAVDYNIPLTLCTIELDASRASNEQREHAVLHVLKLVKNQLREYDVVAHVDEYQLALGLVGYKLQEAQNWTETMRREVASSPVDVHGKRLSFTVSVGIAQAEPRDAWDDVIAHSQAALAISKKVGNKVTVFA